MLIHFMCPKCGQKYKAKAKQAGKKGRCRSCDSTLHVPKYDDSAEFSDTLELSTSALGTPMRYHLANVKNVLLRIVGRTPDE